MGPTEQLESLSHDSLGGLAGQAAHGIRKPSMGPIETQESASPASPGRVACQIANGIEQPFVDPIENPESSSLDSLGQAWLAKVPPYQKTMRGPCRRLEPVLARNGKRA